MNNEDLRRLIQAFPDLGRDLEGFNAEASELGKALTRCLGPPKALKELTAMQRKRLNRKRRAGLCWY